MVNHLTKVAVSEHKQVCMLAGNKRAVRKRTWAATVIVPLKAHRILRGIYVSHTYYSFHRASVLIDWIAFTSWIPQSPV